MDAKQEDIGAVTLRPVTATDREFLLAVYAAGREIELAMVPWDDAMKRGFVEHQFDAQDAFYREEYPDSTHEVILSNGEPVGRLYLHRTTEEIAILDIAVLAKFRKNGLATHVVRDLQEQARSSGKSLRIYIEPFNPADKLFTELGFTKTSDDGISRRYEWRP